MKGFPVPSVTSSNCPFFIQATVKNPKTLHWLSWLTNKGSKSSQLRSWNQQVLDIFARKTIEVIGWLSKKPRANLKVCLNCVLLVECLGYYGKDWLDPLILFFLIDHALTPTLFSSSLLIDWSFLLFPLLHLHSCFLLCCLILLRAVLLGVQPVLDWHLSNLSFTLLEWDDLCQRQATNSGCCGVKWTIIVSFYSLFYVIVEDKQRSVSFFPFSQRLWQPMQLQKHSAHLRLHSGVTETNNISQETEPGWQRAHRLKK